MRYFSLILFSVLALAQPPNQIRVVANDPAGACIGPLEQFSIASGSAFYCNPSTGNWATLANGGVAPGTVTLVSSGNNSPLFNVTVATPTSTPAFSFALLNFAAHTFYGNNTGGSATPAAERPACGDLSDSVTTCNSLVSPAFTGTPTAPTATTGGNSTQLATDTFVANAISALNPPGAVQAATIAVLSNTPTYANGASGVGATLTAGSNGALTIDGYVVLLNDRILVKNQASALQNGIYTQTTLGTGGVPYVLTRAVDYNSIININYSGEIGILQGSTLNCTGWTLSALITAVGTSSLSYSQTSTGCANINPGGNVKAQGNLPSGNVIVGAGGKTIKDSGTALTALALLASPALTGVPTAPTAAVTDNTTQLATDAFVHSFAVQLVASGTLALATGAISSGTCTTAQTAVATGALTTDNISADFNADPTGATGYAPSVNGGLFLYKYLTANTVNVKVCNNTSASITPGAATLQWRVIR